MCGIIGIISRNAVASVLVESLQRLTYRGYDSAGIATLSNSKIIRRRARGKLSFLEDLLRQDPADGNIGIGHTRWATHGVPSEVNAHPHTDGCVAVVHNGIIENFQELRTELIGKGCVFESETDSEVIVHLVTLSLRKGCTPQIATQCALKRLQGAFAFVLLFSGYYDLLIGARRGSPLAVGYGDGNEMYLGSDAVALASLTRRITYLEDGDWVSVTPSGASIYNIENHPVIRPIRQAEFLGSMVSKGGYSHFMLKEIYDQPQAIGDTLNSLFNPLSRTIILPQLSLDLATVSNIVIVACGTSYYAGLVAKYWLEKIAKILVAVELASEFRYRSPVLNPHGLTLFISQSGETADTLAALYYCSAQKQHTLSIVNAPESTMARVSLDTLQTLAGPEISVASTKAFTTQLTVLACLTIAVAKARQVIDLSTEAYLLSSLIEMPGKVAEILGRDNYTDLIRCMASMLAEAKDVLYLGRGTSFPVAMEGALKLKEISYIHAEGYAAGEIKHGPIALIDETVPVIVLAPPDELFEKTASNIQEVAARGGKIMLLSDQYGVEKLGKSISFSITLPSVDPFVTPILYAVPIQLLAYYVALLKGTDVDQPRNLAKSVTVE